MNMNCCTTRRYGGLGFLAVLSFLAWSSAIHTADAAQFTVVDDTFTITSANNGFYFWLDTDKGPKNWLTPDNFYLGEFYYRFEVLDQPTDRKFMFEFVIWDDGGTETASKYTSWLGGRGSVSDNHSSPSTWWTHKTNGNVNWSDPYSFTRFGVPVWATSMDIITNHPSRPNSQKYWADRDDWFPMTIHATVVAVSQGSTFTGYPTIPEPSTFALLATGLVGVLAYAWRKRK